MIALGAVVTHNSQWLEAFRAEGLELVATPLVEVIQHHRRRLLRVKERVELQVVVLTDSEQRWNEKHRVQQKKNNLLLLQVIVSCGQESHVRSPPTL